MNDTEEQTKSHIVSRLSQQGTERMYKGERKYIARQQYINNQKARVKKMKGNSGQI
jgi:hypothetical protein